MRTLLKLITRNPRHPIYVCRPHTRHATPSLSLSLSIYSHPCGELSVSLSSKTLVHVVTECSVGTGFSRCTTHTRRCSQLLRTCPAYVRTGWYEIVGRKEPREKRRLGVRLCHEVESSRNIRHSHSQFSADTFSLRKFNFNYCDTRSNKKPAFYKVVKGLKY